MFDVIIIGGGPAGLTAAIYTSRERLMTLLLERGLCGGLAVSTELIENYPGFPEGIKGEVLIKGFKKQAERFKAEIAEFNEITRISPLANEIRLQTNKEEYKARAIIVASGSIPKKLNLPGEQKYTGRGVSYCAVCDGPLYKDKDVLVIGGGDAAAEEALSLSKFARKVFLVHRREELRAAKILQEELIDNPKIKLVLNHLPLSINGDDFVRSVTVKNKAGNKEEEIKVSGVFICVGYLPNSKILNGLVELDDSGYIVTNEKMETSRPGIYAAGDVRSKEVKQIAVACGEGTIAALSVRDYLQKKQ